MQGWESIIQPWSDNKFSVWAKILQCIWFAYEVGIIGSAKYRKDLKIFKIIAQQGIAFIQNILLQFILKTIIDS